MLYFYVYLAVINLAAVIITIYDKIRAVRHKWRIKELTLMTIAVLGGSVCMYITMQLIRHKTRKLKFMLGIPVIIVIQFIVYFVVINYVL